MKLNLKQYEYVKIEIAAKEIELTKEQFDADFEYTFSAMHYSK